MTVSGNVSPSIFSLARMTVSSSGTGDITLNTNVQGFLTFDLAGCSTASTGQPLTYAINDTTQSEVGSGVYYSSSLLLQRGSSQFGLKSTNGNSPIAMSNAAQVFITPASYTFQRPTFVSFLSSGSGTYSTPSNCTWIRVRGIGGGGGGGGSGSAGGSNPSGANGGNTTFGTSSLLYAGGGVGGPGGGNSQSGGAGGTAAIGTGPIGIALSGGFGGAASANSATTQMAGGSGGNGVFGGGAGAVYSNGAGSPGATNTGGGGGGGGVGANAAYPGQGGGAGGYFDVIINSPSTAYAYVVGAGGAGSSAGSSGFGGGNGGTGALFIEEHYGS